MNGSSDAATPAAVVYVIDDDDAVRDSLASLLAAKGFLVSTFAAASEFLAVAAALRPGCLITDIRMPGMDGLELQGYLIDRALPFPLIVITGHGDVTLAVRAMKAGAVDFIEKPFAVEAILASISTALAHIAEPGKARRLAAEVAAKLASLTPREHEVLEGLIAGLPNKSIAYDLGISPRTVEIHRARVMEKTGARSLSGLVRMCITAGVQARGT